jgi:hypothetical protein
MNNKIYNFTPKQRKKDLRFYKLSLYDESPLQFLLEDEEWCHISKWYSWTSHAPAWYRRQKNKKLKAKAKQALYKQLTYGIDDINYPLFTKNAGYDWW